MSSHALCEGAIVKLNVEQTKSNPTFEHVGITKDSLGVVLVCDITFYVVWETPSGRQAEFRLGMKSNEIIPTGKYVSESVLLNLQKQDHQLYLGEGLKNTQNFPPVSTFKLSAKFKGGKKACKSRKVRKSYKKYSKSSKVRKNYTI